MNEYRITITMDRNGNPTYSPSTLKAKTGDRIHWVSKVGPFAISFLENSPFSEASLNSRGDGDGIHFTAQKTVQPHARWHHHYSVAVADLSQGPDLATIYLDPGCPEIVVSNDGD